MRNFLNYRVSSISLALIAVMMFITAIDVYSARIKDIAEVEGSTGVQVIGYGLVTGLNRTGDNQMTTYTVQSVSNMLKRFGLTIPSRNPRMRNVAAVMVTATIPTHMKEGSKVDVTVSSIGDATSLQGGVLLMTPVSTADGSIIGMAQGPLSVGGYNFEALGSKVMRNFVTTGRVPNGLVLTENFDRDYVSDNQIRISLREPDFSTVNEVATSINGEIAELNNGAVPIDAATVQVTLPTGLNQSQIIQLIAQIETIDVTVSNKARVVINERTGTVVVGGEVTVSPVVIAHGGLEISIQREVHVPRQAPFTLFPPEPVETASVFVEEEINQAKPYDRLPEDATVNDIAEALNYLEVKPRDLVSIFQALKEAGALQGELIIQ